MYVNSKHTTVSSTNSSHHSTIRSSKTTICSSKTTEISSTNQLPLMDELEKVSSPQLTSTIAYKLIRVYYINPTQSVKFNLHCTSRLARHLVPNAYPFPQSSNYTLHIWIPLSQLSCPSTGRLKYLSSTPIPSAKCWPPP